MYPAIYLNRRLKNWYELSNKYARRLHYQKFGESVLSIIFASGENIGFQSAKPLRMHYSSPSLEDSVYILEINTEYIKTQSFQKMYKNNKKRK